MLVFTVFRASEKPTKFTKVTDSPFCIKNELLGIEAHSFPVVLGPDWAEFWFFPLETQNLSIVTPRHLVNNRWYYPGCAMVNVFELPCTSSKNLPCQRSIPLTSRRHSGRWLSKCYFCVFILEEWYFPSDASATFLNSIIMRFKVLTYEHFRVEG